MKTAFAVSWMLLLLAQEAAAHMALLYPMPRGGVATKQYDGEVHTWIGFNDKRILPCNGYGPGPVTALKAGQVVNVRFWGPALPEDDRDKLPPQPKNGQSQLNQARHGGGECQFSLSTDGGKTFHMIGQYTHSCPDFYYEWPVKIPDNIPSCTTANKCLFVWSWTAHLSDQFYQNCADVSIKGIDNGVYPKDGIDIVDVKGFKSGVAAVGDAAGDKEGRGPLAAEVKNNLNGDWM